MIFKKNFEVFASENVIACEEKNFYVSSKLFFQAKLDYEIKI